MDMLQNDSEEWVSDEDQMQELVTNFYKKLFEDDNEDEQFILSGMFPTLGKIF